MKRASRVELCPIPVFVDEGFPFGQCLRERGHTGLCDVYDGRPDPLPPIAKRQFDTTCGED